MSARPAPLWDALANVLKWQSWPGHSSAHTLNRLWAKNPYAQGAGVLPPVSREEFEISRQAWDLERLWALLHETQRTDFPPVAAHPPIVIIRWAGVDYLIDGRRRLCYWMREHDEGPHDVLLIQGKAKAEEP
jgi:hypothetical protein